MQRGDWQPAVIKLETPVFTGQCMRQRLAGRTCRRYKRRAVWPRLMEIGSSATSGLQ
jgi:hypothetical protein